MPAGPSSLGAGPGQPQASCCLPATPPGPTSSAGVNDGPGKGSMSQPRTLRKMDLCRHCPPSRGPGGVSEGSPRAVTGVLREEGDTGGSPGGAGAWPPCPGSHPGPIILVVPSSVNPLPEGPHLGDPSLECGSRAIALQHLHLKNIKYFLKVPMCLCSLEGIFPYPRSSQRRRLWRNISCGHERAPP